MCQGGDPKFKEGMNNCLNEGHLAEDSYSKSAKTYETSQSGSSFRLVIV